MNLSRKPKNHQISQIGNLKIQRYENVSLVDSPLVDVIEIEHQGSTVCRISPFALNGDECAQRIVSCVNALEGIKNPEAVKDLIDAANKQIDCTLDHFASFDDEEKSHPMQTRLNDCLNMFEKALAKLEGKS